MNDFVASYFLFNFFASLVVTYASYQRKVGSISVLFISFVFSALLGFLYVLCHPTIEDYDYHTKMMQYMKRVNNQDEE